MNMSKNNKEIIDESKIQQLKQELSNSVITDREIRKMVAEIADLLYDNPKFRDAYDAISDASAETLENKMFKIIKTRIQNSYNSNRDLMS